jgi:phage/plasmid-like protein (TIGR03299 family)
MSTETSEWLNQNVLVGHTAKRGNAWHYKASDQGEESNHYEGAVPVEDVRRRLFNWQAVAQPMFIQVGDQLKEVPNKVAIVRNDTNEILGVPSGRYVPHQYDDALLTQVESILDDNITIGSAGLLKGGAIGWVQVEMPENMKVADVEFRPHLLATTSFNGSIATTYKRTVTVVVCDNTRAAALEEKGQEYRIRHTANSGLRIASARDALQIVYQLGDDFAREVEQLLSVKVTDQVFDKFVTQMFPVADDAGTLAQNKAWNNRELFGSLWENDERVAPWKGTAYGVLQLVNTHRHHFRPIKGATVRAERNMMDTLTGVTEESDKAAIKRLLALV